jgi:phosphate transport system protein
MADPHTSRDFEAELRELRSHLLTMGARCERGVRTALEAFITKSIDLATEVKELDRLIDRDEMECDELALRIMALRQPVAHDLRFLATVMRLVTDLERIGDEAVNIAERAEEAATEDTTGLPHPHLRELSEL